MAYFLIIAVCIIALIIGSITDIKTREVPDWLNYSLVAAGLGIRLIWALAAWDIWILLYGVFGFLVFLALAYLMFYTGQWGGGDSKMLIGLGALIGLDFKLNTFMLSFLINMLFIGALYGVVWSCIIAFRNKKNFVKVFRDFMLEKSFMLWRRAVLIISLALLVSVFFVPNQILKLLILVIVFVMIIVVYLFTFIKAVEKIAMLKRVTPMQLTEGDWIVKDIHVDGKYIAGPKDLGIEKKQIKKLIDLYKKGKVKKILVKDGIPFVPSFLIAFIVTLIWGNVILMVI